jgi:diadenosine tetraphosphatase ApaH/serine/threonine PP2A family protein phosphatase
LRSPVILRGFSLKIALISDIHGNLEALKAALESLEHHGAERVFCLGDVVGYGANPAECLDLVQSRCEVTLLGNHDAAVVGKEGMEHFNDFARLAINWTRGLLTTAHEDFLLSLPLEISLENIHLVHSSPSDPQAWNYIVSAYDAETHFRAIQGNICFVGHSHIPGEYFESLSDRTGRRLVNVGSVGQPRDRDSRLCYVLYDTISGLVEFIREAYDVDAAAGKIRRAGLPEFLADRLYWGR